MKTYNNLYDKLISEENIRLAITNCCKGKVKRRKFKQLKANPEMYVEAIKKYLMNFENAKHTPKLIYDGISRKQRTIIVPTMMEQVVHHCIVNLLKPIISKSFYYHSYGSIPEKGPHIAKEYVSKYIANRKPKYCLQMDIKKYFDSIPNNILKDKFKKIIKDEKFLDILFKILDVIPKGIPLGFYTSQWIANFYLTDMDHYIKEVLKAKCYVRYMDDMIILGDDKSELHNIRYMIEKKLNEIGLEMKRNYTVCPIEKRNIDFLGFRFYKNKTTLRRKLYYKACSKARRISKKSLTIYTVRQMLAYKGWMCISEVKKAYKDKIEPLISFETCQKYASEYDKRRNLCNLLKAKVA